MTEGRFTEQPVVAPIEAVSVVVPAHDEEVALPACLHALDQAAGAVVTRWPRLSVTLCIVLDACADGSRPLAHAFAATFGSHPAVRVVVVEVEERSVGPARARGFDVVLNGLTTAGVAADRAWIASTDADTVVPPSWLVEQILRADRGVDVVVGTVEPDTDLDPTQRAAWQRLHQLVDGHPHVHGANLGIRASTYRASGGFAPLAQHEDVDLVARLRLQERITVDATDATRVVTSSRTVGRAVGGFSGYLADLRDSVS